MSNGRLMLDQYDDFIVNKTGDIVERPCTSLVRAGEARSLQTHRDRYRVAHYKARENLPLRFLFAEEIAKMKSL